MTRILCGATMASALALISTLACHTAQPAPPTLPNLATTTAETATDATMYVYGVLQSAVDTVNSASKLEDHAHALGAVPAPVDTTARALFVDIAKGIQGVTRDIDNKVLQEWPAIQARVNPILSKAQDLYALAKAQGPSIWTKIVTIGMGALLQALGSGALTVAPSPSS